jgi:putative flippase GtrA
MLSFGVIGLGNTVIDFDVFTLAYKVLELPLVASNVLAWGVAVSGSYVMNTTFTFRAESGRVFSSNDYLRFVVSGVLGVVATTTTLVVLSHYLPVIAAKLIPSSLALRSISPCRTSLSSVRACGWKKCRRRRTDQCHLGRQNPNKNNTIRRSAGVFVLKTPMMSLMAWLHDV